MSDGIIEFAPRLAMRRASECAHAHVEVDEDAADLSCTDCGAALDPWWFIRGLAEYEQHERDARQKQIDDHARWVATANETIARLTREVSELTAAKNRLWNEQVNGAPLGTQVRRRRRA